jgi:hypothetical protein
VTDVKNESKTATGEVSSLLSQLRERANALSEREREVALEHVDKLHEEASVDAGDTLRMRVWLKGLEIFPSLAPIVAEVLEALANVGV